MSIGIAQIKQVIGLRANVSNCISYQDEQTIVYPAGANVVVYNIDQKTQKFIPNSDKSTGLTTMCVSSNKRYIAIAERVADKPLVTVYDLHTLRKKKTLTILDTQSSEIVSMSFSPDSKHLITQTAAPDWSLYYWSWEKSKIMAYTRITANLQPGATVAQVSFNPQDNSQICVVGNGLLKMYRYADGVLKNYLTLKQDMHNFMSHAWLPDERLVAGNNRAELFLIQNCEILAEYRLMEKAGPEEGSVYAILPFSKGFIAACGKGNAYLYEKIDDPKEFFGKKCNLKIPSDQYSNDPSKTEEQSITSMCISPSEETLLVVTNWQQIYQLVFSNIDVGKVIGREWLGKPEIGRFFWRGIPV